MIPDNIKEEIGQQARQHADKYWDRLLAPNQWAEVFYAYQEGATKFYELGKRDLVAALEELSLEQLKALKSLEGEK